MVLTARYFRNAAGKQTNWVAFDGAADALEALSEQPSNKH